MSRSQTNILTAIATTKETPEEFKPVAPVTDDATPAAPKPSEGVAAPTKETSAAERKPTSAKMDDDILMGRIATAAPTEVKKDEVSG